MNKLYEITHSKFNMLFTSLLEDDQCSKLTLVWAQCPRAHEFSPLISTASHSQPVTTKADEKSAQMTI